VTNQRGVGECRSSQLCCASTGSMDRNLSTAILAIVERNLQLGLESIEQAITTQYRTTK
jgi:hypothetical protein